MGMCENPEVQRRSLAQPALHAPEVTPPVPVCYLNLQDYWKAVAAGGPLPSFTMVRGGRLGPPKKGKPVTVARQVHIVRSPLSAEFYELAHGVDRLIVADVRRRAQRALDAQAEQNRKARAR